MSSSRRGAGIKAEDVTASGTGTSDYGDELYVSPDVELAQQGEQVRYDRTLVEPAPPEPEPSSANEQDA